MLVAEGIERLRALATRTGREVDLSFAPVPDESAVESVGGVHLSPELRSAYRRGAPAGEFPPFVQHSQLFRFEELPGAQIGYSVDMAGDPEPGWDRSWLVIGADDGDPFIAHVDRPGTPVSLAVHGTGTWRPVVVADDLGSFYALVSEWSALLLDDFDGERCDEDLDFADKPGFWDLVEQRLSRTVSARCVASLRGYLSI